MTWLALLVVAILGCHAETYFVQIGDSSLVSEGLIASGIWPPSITIAVGDTIDFQIAQDHGCSFMVGQTLANLSGSIVVSAPPLFNSEPYNRSGLTSPVAFNPYTFQMIQPRTTKPPTPNPIPMAPPIPSPNGEWDGTHYISAGQATFTRNFSVPFVAEGLFEFCDIYFLRCGNVTVINGTPPKTPAEVIAEGQAMKKVVFDMREEFLLESEAWALKNFTVTSNDGFTQHNIAMGYNTDDWYIFKFLPQRDYVVYPGDVVNFYVGLDIPFPTPHVATFLNDDPPYPLGGARFLCPETDYMRPCMPPAPSNSTPPSNATGGPPPGGGPPMWPAETGWPFNQSDVAFLPIILIDARIIFPSVPENATFPIVPNTTRAEGTQGVGDLAFGPWQVRPFLSPNGTYSTGLLSTPELSGKDARQAYEFKISEDHPPHVYDFLCQLHLDMNQYGRLNVTARPQYDNLPEVYHVNVFSTRRDGKGACSDYQYIHLQTLKPNVCTHIGMSYPFEFYMLARPAYGPPGSGITPLTHVHILRYDIFGELPPCGGIVEGQYGLPVPDSECIMPLTGECTVCEDFVQYRVTWAAATVPSLIAMCIVVVLSLLF